MHLSLPAGPFSVLQDPLFHPPIKTPCIVIAAPFLAGAGEKRSFNVPPRCRFYPIPLNNVNHILKILSLFDTIMHKQVSIDK
jgi:hypothetical protein